MTHSYPMSDGTEGNVQPSGGKNKMSGDRDNVIGRPRKNGMTHTEDESNFSESEMAESGLNKREPL